MERHRLEPRDLAQALHDRGCRLYVHLTGCLGVLAAQKGECHRNGCDERERPRKARRLANSVALLLDHAETSVALARPFRRPTATNAASTNKAPAIPRSRDPALLGRT